MRSIVLAAFWIAQATSLVIFLLGCLVLLAGAVIVWAVVGVAIGKNYDPLLGFVYLFGTIYLAAKMERYLRVPWQLWLALWQWADGQLSARKYVASSELTIRDR